MNKTVKRTAIAAAIGLTFCLQSTWPGLNPLGIAQAQASNPSGAPLSNAQLQSLVSPIALYPDALLSQMLMAATYPLEVAEAYNWLEGQKGKSREELQAAVKNETWDNSVKSLVLFPEALTMMGTKLSWTQQLGDAYLAQPKALMDAVQSLRQRAQRAGNLKSNNQVTVSAQQSDIIIQPANPQVIYVPQYNPSVVYGGWPYPAYPPAPVYNPAWGFMTFGLGMAVGAALWSTPHWNSGSITINNNNFNNFNRNFNSDINRAPDRVGGSSAWQFNQAHRGNVPFNNAELNRRYGDAASRDAIARNQAQRLQQRQQDWARNATPQQRSDREATRQRAQQQFSHGGFDHTNRFSGDRFSEQHFGGDHFGGMRMGGFRR